MNTKPLLTVCIPAYNRAAFLDELLHSIFKQEFKDFNVLICEDNSPERAQIASIAQRFSLQYPNQVFYEENQINLGYDGNIRQLISLATGHYCVFMGNDDLMCSGALACIADIVSRVPDCGIVVRSYATFDKDPSDYKQIYRYYPSEVVFEPGIEAITTAYRRSVVIPGMVIHRDLAASYSTDQFDGTLLYQLYLVGMLLASKSVVFTPQVLALRRDGNLPDFGNSLAEKGNFSPKEQTPDSSIFFMRGMLAIAAHIEIKTKLPVFREIRADIGHYSYPILSIQAKRPFTTFVPYVFQLAKLGFWRYPLFYCYFVLLLILKPDHIDHTIKFIKGKLGYTPAIGKVFRKKT